MINFPPPKVAFQLPTFVAFLLMLSLPVQADDRPLRFVVVPQGVGNDFFDDVKVGCEQAAEDLGGVECLYGGPKEADFRTQSDYINQQIEAGVDGIAVSVINSEFLAKGTALNAQKQGIPLISFNSDFKQDIRDTYQQIRATYVGTDNFQMGRDLGEQTKLLRPNGGRLCLISGHQSSNALQQRLSGVRAALAGTTDSSGFVPKLEGQNGWTEYSRCPFYSNDLPFRALKQLKHVLNHNRQHPEQIDTVVVVGAWPQQDEQAYRETIEPYLEALSNKEIVIVMGDAMKQQIRLLKDHLAHANVGQNPYQMGYQAIVALKQLSEGKSVPDIIYTPMITCLPDRTPACSE